MQSRHCAGAGGWRSPPRLCKLFPKASAEPSGARHPLPLLPHASALAWSVKEAGSPPRLHGLGFGKGWRAAEAFPRICGKSGSGKVLQSSQQRLPRSPLRGEQTAASAPVSPPPAQSSGLARSLGAARAPGGQALLPGRKPQLTQAARKAEATRPNCPGRTTAPTPGACLGTQAAHRGGGPAEALRAAQSHGLLHVPPGSFLPLGTRSPGQWFACGVPQTSKPPGTSRSPPTPSKFLPSPSTRRKGACPLRTRPL